MKLRPASMHHFVDEAGDLTLFNRKRQVILGRDGVSDHFMLGVALIPDPAALDAAMARLRLELLSDPFLNRIPSLQPDRRKTACAFHAKDDVPEVRIRVFQLLATFEIKVFVAIRTKRVLVEQARALNRIGRPLSENEIYDELFSKQFRNRLHLADVNEIVVARRGSKDRTKALMLAVLEAQTSFRAKAGEREFGKVRLRTARPSESSGLQAVDYFLWALQRLYERREDRFFAPLARHYRLIMDLDDTGRRPNGEWYSNSNPLTLEKLKLVTG
ncbi:MAG: DUF3800 domain-containing protein [Acidobacteriota bacterium]|nr:DUF3800 domain-containing protein [Acidobacteriota bacterium]